MNKEKRSERPGKSGADKQKGGTSVPPCLTKECGQAKEEQRC